MQVNSIGALNTVKSTSFGKKENNKCSSDCTPRDKSMVTIPRVVYAAMLAAVLGGPLTGCDPDGKYIEPETTEAGQNNGTMKDGEVTTPYVVTPEELAAQAPSPVQQLLKSVFEETLGLKITTPVNTSLHVNRMKAATVQPEVITDISFADPSNELETFMHLNKDESTKDKQVYYAKVSQSYKGELQGVEGFRYTMSQVDNALIIKKELDMNDGNYLPQETYEFTSNPDKTVSQKWINPDGSKVLKYTYEPKTEKSLTRINRSGVREVLDKFEILNGN